MVVEEFQTVLTDALLAVIRLGLPLAILFLIGCLIYLRSRSRQ